MDVTIVGASGGCGREIVTQIECSAQGVKEKINQWWPYGN